MSQRQNTPKKKPPIDTRPILEELEPRQLFSGGLEGVLFDDPLAEPPIYLDITNETSGPGSALVAEFQSSESEGATERQELVFIDTDVENYQELLNDILAQDDSERNIEVILLDNQRDGIEQISEALAGYQNLDAVHLISHGSEGSVDVGNTRLDSDSLIENSAAIKAWGESFSEEGDFLIYGCNLAATEDGQSLIDALSSLTEADVAASDDLTGHESLGGDWELEYDSGTIESKIAISAHAQQNWAGVLADTTTDLVAHYSFDIDAHDSSGNLSDGTLQGGAIIDTVNATDKVGEGKLSLDGSGDYVDLTSHVSSFSGLINGTISAWVNISSSNTGTNTIFDIGDGAGNSNYVSLYVANGNLTLTSIDGGATVLDVVSTSTINDDTWHHVAFSSSSTGNALYIDGVQLTEVH